MRFTKNHLFFLGGGGTHHRQSLVFHERHFDCLCAVSILWLREEFFLYEHFCQAAATSAGRLTLNASWNSAGVQWLVKKKRNALVPIANKTRKIPSPAVSRIRETLQMDSLKIFGCIVAQPPLWLTAGFKLPPSSWQDTLNRPHNSDVQPLIYRADKTNRATMTNTLKRRRKKKTPNNNKPHKPTCNLRLV